MATLRSHQSGTGKIGNPVCRCPTQLATIFYHQKNFPAPTYEIIMLGNKFIINLMARERISLYTPRFCYRQATGHTHTPHNQIEGSWFSTLQIWCALNSAISTPRTQWRTTSKSTIQLLCGENSKSATQQPLTPLPGSSLSVAKINGYFISLTQRLRSRHPLFTFVLSKMTVGIIIHAKLSISTNMNAI